MNINEFKSILKNINSATSFRNKQYTSIEVIGDKIYFNRE